MSKTTILISQYELPYPKVSSWPKMLEFYFKQFETVKITNLICPPCIEKDKFNSVRYNYVYNNILSKIITKLTKKKYYNFIKTASEIIKSNKLKSNILIIDNANLLFELDYYLRKKNIREKANIIFFIHGYSYFFDSSKSHKFFNSVNHIVYLSEKSYQFELSRAHSISALVSILPNGINLNIFNPIDKKDKPIIKEILNIGNKFLFLWCANERPKKGLQTLIKAWEKTTLSKNPNVELIIIGTTYKHLDGNIRYLGCIQNEDLPQYYQIADLYLFTTLCHEGFPLSLAEAIACGTRCIVSQIAPLPEIFSKFGNIAFVENPHIIQSWVEILEQSYSGNIYFPERKDELIQNELSMHTWINGFNNIIST
jgi:L-malate glycosyltransferase